MRLLFAGNTEMMVFLCATPLFADHNIMHILSPQEHMSGVCCSHALQKYGGNSRALTALSNRGNRREDIGTS